MKRGSGAEPGAAPKPKKRIIFNLPPYRRPAPPPATNYKTFLNSLVGKAPANLTAAEVNNWEDVDRSTPMGQIIDEIAKKFNNNAPPLGINNVEYNPNIQPSFYSMLGVPANSPPNTVQPSQMELSSRENGDIGRVIGPEPITIGHELVHANDHQIDQLNPRVWQNLGNLAKGIDPNNAQATPMGQSNFFASLGKIKKKIDPVQQAFFEKYPMDSGKIATQISAARGGGQRYDIPMTGWQGKSTDWQQLFNDINNVVTSPAPAGGVRNQGFHLPFASEFPAYMAENLPRRWETNRTIPPTRHTYGVPALSKPEARFLHQTLGDMDTAYPAADYPTMNQHIRERRNSIADAYYPPANGGAAGSGVPAAGFAYGGHIKAKPKRYGLSSYLQG